jgi:hypothetical protein
VENRGSVERFADLCCLTRGSDEVRKLARSGQKIESALNPRDRETKCFQVCNGSNNRPKGQLKHKAQFKGMNVTRSQNTSSSAAPARKSTTSKTGLNAPSGRSKSPKKSQARPSGEQVALRAYFIAERRRTLGIQGDETSDWVAAERELLEELKAK